MRTSRPAATCRHSCKLAKAETQPRPLVIANPFRACSVMLARRRLFKLWGLAEAAATPEAVLLYSSQHLSMPAGQCWQEGCQGLLRQLCQCRGPAESAASPQAVILHQLRAPHLQATAAGPEAWPGSSRRGCRLSTQCKACSLHISSDQVRAKLVLWHCLSRGCSLPDQLHSIQRPHDCRPSENWHLPPVWHLPPIVVTPQASA